MEEAQYQDPYSAMASRLRDLEEKQNLIKDRLILVGNSLIEDKDKSSIKLQAMKTDIAYLKEDVSKIKNFLQKISEQIDKFAKKSEMEILQKQFDLFRKE
jgi:uncharacterized protein (DUF342 family)